MPDPHEPRPEDQEASLSRRERSFDWSRLMRADSPAPVLERLGRWLGPQVVELSVGPVEPSAENVAVWRRSPSAGSIRHLSVLVPGEPVWRLTAGLVGERKTVRAAVERAALLLEAWREARCELNRSDSRLAARSRELDLLQALGRGAAEARTPRQLFTTVAQVLHRSEQLDLALAAYEIDGAREMCTFLARPFDERYLLEVGRRAGNFMSWTTEHDVTAQRDELEGFDPAVRPRVGFREEDLVLLPTVRRGQPVACLLVVPPATAEERGLRLLYGASNQLSLHLERILTVREAEADRFRAIVDSMPQGVLLADSRLQILQANLPALQMLASVGIAGGSLARQLDGLGLRELVDRVREGASLAEGETYVDEDRVWSVTVSPMLGDGGRLEGLVFVMTDVTESRRLQQRLAQSEKMSSLGQMISGVAHELNNPLASVVGYAQLVRNGGADEGLDRKLEILSREAERCKKIVQNLLAFVRQREPERRSLSLNQIVTGVLSLLAYQMRVDDVTVETDLDPELPSIEGDPHQLEQMLVNLMTNGRHAIRGTDRPGTITLRTWPSRDDAVVLEVTDSGPGIPEEIRGRIFDPFFTTKGPGKGTGLGLSLVYGIVAAHGGNVDVVSGEGRGTTFRILLPVGQPVGETDERSGVEPVAASRRKGRILVVDDEEPVARLICDALAADGHVTQRAANGLEALARLEGGDYDLIISDLRMPGMSGEQLHEALRRDRPELSSRLLLTTGDTLERAPEEFVARTGLDVLRKPFDVDDLLRKVQQRLARDD